MAENDPVEKVLRLFVYTPLGVAAYLRDSAPTFMELFVARGRLEVGKARSGLEAKLGRSAPEAAPEPPLAQRVVDGLGKVAAQAGTVAAQAGSVVAAMAGPVVSAAAGAASAVTNPAPASAPDPAPATPTAEPPATPVPDPAGGADGLPIPGYDQLSASQIVERLDGLSKAALDRIKLYELAHRARRTILATIDTLTAG